MLWVKSVNNNTQKNTANSHPCPYLLECTFYCLTACRNCHHLVDMIGALLHTNQRVLYGTVSWLCCTTRLCMCADILYGTSTALFAMEIFLDVCIYGKEKITISYWQVLSSNDCVIRISIIYKISRHEMGFCTWRFLSLIVCIVFVSRVPLSLHYSHTDILCLHVFVCRGYA